MEEGTNSGTESCDSAVSRHQYWTNRAAAGIATEIYYRQITNQFLRLSGGREIRRPRTSILGNFRPVDAHHAATTVARIRRALGSSQLDP